MENKSKQKHKRERDKDIINLLSTNTPPESPDERTSVAFPVDLKKIFRKEKSKKGPRKGLQGNKEIER